MSEEHGELQIVRGLEISEQTGQTAGLLRRSGVDRNLTRAERIWMGRVSNEPGYRSKAHHHGEAETAGFVLKGEARLYFGDGFSEHVDMEEGDFVFVPPHFPHIEANRSDENELVWLTARTPDNIVVNLEVDESAIPGAVD